jgi:hypothetical protein
MLHQFLRTQMEPCGFINSTTQTLAVNMELSLRLSFYLRGFSPTISLLNPAEVPIVTYEYLSFLLIPWWCPPCSPRGFSPTISSTESCGRAYRVALEATFEIKAQAEAKFHMYFFVSH